MADNDDQTEMRIIEDGDESPAFIYGVMSDGEKVRVRVCHTHCTTDGTMKCGEGPSDPATAVKE